METKRAIVTALTVERNITMPKYYIKCGTLEMIYSTNKKPMRAAASVLWETNKFDVLDEYFYVDERGFKDYLTAHPDTKVYKTEKIIEKAGWTME
jgi:hypothetical protein